MGDARSRRFAWIRPPMTARSARQERAMRGRVLTPKNAAISADFARPTHTRARRASAGFCPYRMPCFNAYGRQLVQEVTREREELLEEHARRKRDRLALRSDHQMIAPPPRRGVTANAPSSFAAGRVDGHADRWDSPLARALPSSISPTRAQRARLIICNSSMMLILACPG